MLTRLVSWVVFLSAADCSDVKILLNRSTTFSSEKQAALLKQFSENSDRNVVFAYNCMRQEFKPISQELLLKTVPKVQRSAGEQTEMISLHTSRKNDLTGDWYGSPSDPHELRNYKVALGKGKETLQAILPVEKVDKGYVLLQMIFARFHSKIAYQDFTLELQHSKTKTRKKYSVIDLIRSLLDETEGSSVRDADFKLLQYLSSDLYLPRGLILNRRFKT